MKCRHCGQPLHLPFLDLGSAPPSNAYLSEAALRAPETWFPLRVLVCTHCWLVQTEDHAGREALFTHDYAYFSSFSTSWLAHAQTYVQAMQQRLGLNASSCVAEVAANDGYLLQYVRAAGIPCYGIEPTASTAAAARAKGIEVVERFFGVALADELAGDSAGGGRQADLIAANNVLAHVPDINDFVAGFARLLKPQGVATFEFPHLLRMVQGGQFDTAYHEHYSYLSLTAVQRIFAANGLAVIDVQELATHGGSLRVFAARADAAHHPQATPEGAARVQQLLATEAAAGMLEAHFYSDFQAQALRIKRELLTFLLQCQAQGITVGAYGAAAKGNTLLNFAGVRPDLLPYVVDKNPAKQGQYLPGSRIPIVDEAHLRAHRPDRVLILPWNLRDEVAGQLSYVREWGGQFVVAVPRLEVFSFDSHFKEPSAMTSNDPRDLDGKRLQQAMQALGRDPALRARMIALLRESEGHIVCEGSVRDEVVGPIIDALHLDTDEYEKVLADGTRFQFLYRTKIARDFLLSESEHPTHVWEPQTTKLLLELGRDLQGDVLVGGAYFGDQAVLVAKQLAGRGQRVHCFEPNPQQARMLQRNIDLNHLNNVTVNVAGLWSRSGERMRLDGFDSFANMVSAQDGSGFDTVTMDDYAQRLGLRVGLIQLDIEGAELAALQGAQQVLARDKPYVVFELHRHYVDWSNGLRATPLCRLLLDLGYTVFAVRDINSHREMPGQPVELVPLDTVYLDGPPHGFNMLAVPDAARVQGSAFRIVEGVSPKLLPHKAPHLHHPVGGF